MFFTQMRVVTRLASALALLTLLLGCGAYHRQERVGSVTTATSWREDTSGSTVVLGQPKAEADRVYFPLLERYQEREYSFLQTQYEMRRIQEPDLFFVVCTLGMPCLLGMPECWGRWPSWRDDGPPVKTNYRPTGELRTLERRNDLKVSAKVSLEGFSADRQSLGTSKSGYSGTDYIVVGIRDFAQGLPSRPARIDVQVALPGGPAATHSMADSDLARLQLYAEHWLPAEERRAIYSEQLRKCLLARDWAGASPLFAKIEGLGLPLPASFHYHYGRSLLLAGKVEQGKGYLRRYLEQATAESEYLEKAQQLLGGNSK